MKYSFQKQNNAPKIQSRQIVLVQQFYAKYLKYIYQYYPVGYTHGVIGYGDRKWTMSHKPHKPVCDVRHNKHKTTVWLVYIPFEEQVQVFKNT